MFSVTIVPYVMYKLLQIVYSRASILWSYSVLYVCPKTNIIANTEKQIYLPLFIYIYIYTYINIHTKIDTPTYLPNIHYTI